jgi:phospholipid/cholesterol/gamma-HCH transport system substrate-binding protein
LTPANPAESGGATVSSRSSTLLRVVILGVFACAVVLLALLIFSGGSGYKYKLQFENASLIVPGNLVMVGGHPVGSVDGISLTEDSMAEMEVELDEPIHEGSTFIVRKRSLSSVHNHYLSLTPGPDNAPEIPEGTVLGEENTTSAVEIDQFFDVFDEKTRKGLSGVFRGINQIYAGDAAEGANQTFKYSGASFSSTQRLMAELSDQDSKLDVFVRNVGGLMTTLASVAPEITDLVGNADTALNAIGRENESLSLALRELPPTLRQGSTTLVNLRQSLDVIEPLLKANARAADAGLAGFLENQLRPVLNRARPVFSNLATAAGKQGVNNDTSDLLSSLIPLESRSKSGFDAFIPALDYTQEEVSETRAWSPDVFAAFAKLGAASSNYDVHGHYTRVRPTAMGLYQLNGTTVEPASTAIYGGLNFVSGIQRCPGGSTQAIPGSNPFLDDGNLVGKCDPSQVP